MSNRYKGGFITATPPTTSSSSQSAPGIWTTTQQMQIVAAGNWPPFIPADPYFDYVTMLLTGDGTNGAQNNTFVDSSTNNFTITRNGNTTQGSFSPYGSLWSNYFTTSAYLGLGSSSNWTLGSSGDFTVEGWIFANGTQDSFATVVTNTTSEASGYENKFIVLIRSGNILSWRDDTGSTSISATMALNQWNHFAFVRSGSTITGYLNGTSIGTQTSAQAYTSTGTSLLIGGGVASANSFKGYISNLRIVKGTAVYTSNFTPSTTPLTAVTNTVLLTCQSNRFIDNSSNNATITASGTPSVQRFSPFNPTASYSTATIGGSGYFDGSGDYLQSGTNVALGSSDFTLETWVYYTGTSGDGSLICEDNGGTSRAFMMYRNSNALTHAMYLGTGSGGWDILNNFPWNTSPKLYTWNHFAVTRSGNTIRLYLNGVLDNSTTISGTVGTRNLIIGGQPGTGTYTNGYMTDSRILVGTALYTGSTYTVPTSPLTAVSNTQLLLNYTNAGIPDSAMMNDLETKVNAQVSTSVKKFGTGSLYFNGSLSYLTSQSSPNYSFGTGDFTVEGWVYFNSLTGEPGIFQIGSSQLTPSTNSIAVAGQGTDAWFIYANGYSGTITAPNNLTTWQHFALVRYSGVLTLYINGTNYYSATNTSNFNYTYCTVGGYYDTSYLLNGYVDDFRVTKGYARYTANFTPPTEAFPTY